MKMICSKLLQTNPAEGENISKTDLASKVDITPFGMAQPLRGSLGSYAAAQGGQLGRVRVRGALPK